MAMTRSGTKTFEPSLSRWLPSVLLMVAYAVAAYANLPMTLQALPAIAALLFLPGAWRKGFLPDPAVAGLCIMGLPAVAMINFYFGYPMRLCSAVLAVPVLNGAGFNVVRDGVVLAWQGQAIGVDVPCSGIRMGWTAVFLAFTGAGLSGLGWWRTCAVAFAAMVIAILANALRVVILFGVETIGWSERGGLHAGIGVILFVVVAAGVLAFVLILKPRPA